MSDIDILRTLFRGISCYIIISENKREQKALTKNLISAERVLTDNRYIGGNIMTPLYFDTYAGCEDNYSAWTIEDEGKKNLFDLIMGLFR